MSLALDLWAWEWRRVMFARPWTEQPGPATCEGTWIADQEPPSLPLTCPECGRLIENVMRNGESPEGDPLFRILPHTWPDRPHPEVL